MRGLGLPSPNTHCGGSLDARHPIKTIVVSISDGFNTTLHYLERQGWWHILVVIFVLHRKQFLQNVLREGRECLIT
jgi:hypothetical protein